MENKKDTEKKEKTSSQGKVEGKKEEKKEAQFCKDCKWYDKSTEREFHRKVGPRNEKGERTEIIEIRAICRNEKADAYSHLVMAEYAKRQCPVWERGIYVKPVGEQKQSAQKKVNEKKGQSRKKKSAVTKADSTKTNVNSNEDLVKT